MLSQRRRIRRLEQSPYFQPPPDPSIRITEMALRSISDEDLDLLLTIGTDQEAGLCRNLSAREIAAVAAYEAAIAKAASFVNCG